MRQFYAASVFDDARIKGDRRGGGAERNAVALVCGKITKVYIFGSDCNVLEISLEQCGVTAAVRAQLCDGTFDQSEYDPARVCGAGTAGIHLYSEGKGKFCGRQSGNERE